MRPLSSSMLFLSVAAVALSGQVAALGAEASAAPTWAPTVRLAPHPRGASLAVDAQDNDMVVWQTSSGKIKFLQRSAGGDWGDPRVIGRSEWSMADPQVAADRDGNVTVVWVAQRRGFTDGVLAARRRVGHGWSDPVRISHDLRVRGYPGDHKGPWGAASPRLAVSPRGAVAVAWQWGSEDRNKSWRIQSAYRAPGRSWGKTARVTPATGAEDPQVGIAGDGTVTLLYGRQRLGHPQTLLSRVRRPGGGWTVPAVITREGYAPRLGVDRAGNAVVVYTPNWYRVMAAYRREGGHWRSPQRLTPPGVRAAASHALAMNARGTAVVVWPRRDGHVDLVRRTATGHWSAPVSVVEKGAYEVDDVSVALNAAGDTFVACGNYALFGVYQPRDGGDWSSPTMLSPETDVDVMESLDSAVTPGGDVVVLWKQEDMPLKVRAGVSVP